MTSQMIGKTTYQDIAGQTGHNIRGIFTESVLKHILVQGYQNARRFSQRAIISLGELIILQKK